MKKVRLIESTIFFIGSLLIMLAGADFPPPRGFWLIVAIIFLFAVVQYYYLGWLIDHLNLKRSLPISIVLFAVLGALVATGMVLGSAHQPFPDVLIWVGIVAIVAGVYGLMVWLVTWLIEIWRRRHG